MSQLLHVYLHIRIKICTGSLLLKHTMFFIDISFLYDFYMTFVYFYATYERIIPVHTSGTPSQPLLYQIKYTYQMTSIIQMQVLT